MTNPASDGTINQTGPLASRRRFLPLCVDCGHPYQTHVIADPVTHTPGDCFACVERRCDYHYPSPLCARCRAPVEQYLTEHDGLTWHLGCWYSEEQDRSLPRCVRCLRPIELHRVVEEGSDWHRVCWSREKRSRALVAEALEGWEPPEDLHVRRTRTPRDEPMVEHG